MRTLVRVKRAACVPFLLLLLSCCVCGCVLLDQFSGRASEFNFQTADARNTTILLNILRAAYSKPLEFTDVTTVAGTGTLSGTASASIPFTQNRAGQIAARTIPVTPSGTISGTSTVNVANLDTQEFYYGLQTPLSMQQIAYYLVEKSGGLNSKELLPLLISNIELRSDNGTTVILHNRADSRGSFSAFFNAVGFLIDNGLYVEQVKKGPPMTVGPVLSPDEIKDARLLAAIVAAAGGSSSNSSSATPSAGSGGGLTLKEITKIENGKRIVTGYQFQKADSGGGYRFCFTHLAHPFGNNVDYSVLTQPKKSTLIFPLGIALGQPVPGFTVTIGSQFYCGNSASPPASGNARQSAGQGITVTTRSLEEIFVYLGEMARTELGLASGEMTSLAIPSTQEEEKNGEGFRLFSIERRAPSLGEPWVLYNAEVYSIRVDPSGQSDASSRILQIVSDLLALQSSAKNLPAPNLIAITTP